VTYIEYTNNLIAIPSELNYALSLAIDRAVTDFSEVPWLNDTEKYESICCLALFYIAPSLYYLNQKQANEFDLDIEFNDLDSFKHYWKERAYSTKSVKNIKKSTIIFNV
jgi:hypothetical protein